MVLLLFSLFFFLGGNLNPPPFWKGFQLIYFRCRYARAKADSPFRIAWIATDTSLSFNALASGAADMSITYHAYAEKLALRQGIADRCVYAWRDHFMLVGKAIIPDTFSDLASAEMNVQSSQGRTRIPPIYLETRS